MQVSSSYMQNSYHTVTHSLNSPKNGSENEELSKINEETQKDKDDKKQPNELSEEEKIQVSKLQARDSEVRAHEAAHLAAAGGLAAGGASFTYQKGPDGKQYAIGGEVPIDTSPGSTPEETITRARQIKAAATAPANPSGQDMKIASTAAMMEMKAVMELAAQKQEENDLKNSKNPYQISQNNTQTSPLDITA